MTTTGRKSLKYPTRELGFDLEGTGEPAKVCKWRDTVRTQVT